VAGALDFETAASHSVSVRATSTDTSTSEATFTIDVLNEADGVASILSILYTTNGGRNSDKHMFVTLTVEDETGNPISGATVSATISGPDSLTDTGSTDSFGQVTFSIKNAGTGIYSTTVTDVTADGAVWDGITPANSFDKQ
jgi:hypothetical protein